MNISLTKGTSDALNTLNSLNERQSFINNVVTDCMNIKRYKRLLLRRLDASRVNVDLCDGIDVVAFKDDEMAIIKCIYNSDNSVEKNPDEYLDALKTLETAKEYYMGINPGKRIVMMHVKNIGEERLYSLHNI